MLALTIRVAWALPAPQLDPMQINNPLPGDARGYYVLAINLLSGYGFTWDRIQPTSYRMPGFPVFLAGVFTIFGYKLTVVRLIQAILGALLCLPVYQIARNMAGERVAFFASLGVAFYPTFIYLSGWIYSETLYILLLWLGLWVLLVAVSQGNSYSSNSWVGFSLVAGGLWGLATYVRPETAFLPLAIAACVWFANLIGAFAGASPQARKKDGVVISRSLSIYLLTQIAVFAILIPWIIRNSLVQHAFVPLTTSVGANLYAGNNPGSNGGSNWINPLPSMSEYGSDRELGQQAVRWIRENPLRAAQNEFQKFARFFSPFELETQENPFGRWHLFLNAIYGLFLMLAAYGAYRNWRQTEGLLRMVPILLLALVAWFLLSALIFFGGSRIALPVVPVFLIFAALGLLALTNKQYQHVQGAAKSS